MYNAITDLLGNTPLVRFKDNIWAKLEYFNPAGSVKDRIAYAMLSKALARGDLHKDAVIIEATSGNTGISLAFCAAAMGLQFTAVMPENMSDERKKLIRAYGASIVLTPKALGMQGAIDAALALAATLTAEGKHVFMPKQFENPDNPAAHYATTGEEIWEQTQGKVEIVVAGMGSGGTISGIAKKLVEKNPAIIMVGVEAKESPLLTEGHAGPHSIQGISPNFIPETLNRDAVDIIVDVPSASALQTAQDAAHKGFLVGPSSGAVLWAAQELAEKHPKALIVCVLADNGERYLSASS